MFKKYYMLPVRYLANVNLDVRLPSKSLFIPVYGEEYTCISGEKVQRYWVRDTAPDVLDPVLIANTKNLVRVQRNGRIYLMPYFQYLQCKKGRSGHSIVKLRQIDGSDIQSRGCIQKYVHHWFYVLCGKEFR